MFTHVNIDLGYEDLEAITTENGRRYVLPDGTMYPSITTVLSSDPEKAKVLQDWKERVGEVEANKTSFQAANNGTNLHEIVEKYIDNDPNYANGYFPHTKQQFLSLKPFLDSRIGKVYAQECALYSHHLRIAGRVDCVAEWGDKLSIIDFKTSKKFKHKSWIETYFMQEAAYAIMWEEITGIPITQLVTVIALRDSQTPQIFIEHRDKWVKKLLELRDYYYKSQKPL